MVFSGRARSTVKQKTSVRVKGATSQTPLQVVEPSTVPVREPPHPPELSSFRDSLPSRTATEFLLPRPPRFGIATRVASSPANRFRLATLGVRIA